MPITEDRSAFVDTAATTFALSKMFTVTAGSGNPAYLVLTTLDRDEYTAGAGAGTGTLAGNGRTLGFGAIGGDGRGAGIVFSYQASSGRYYNSSYGYFDQLSYTSPGSAGDVTDLSVFGTGSLSLANAYAGNAYDMMQVDPAGYLGTAAVVTQANFAGPVPAQATPDQIATTAEGFVGQDWNQDGCWVLCSTIAAEAGAALPMQSTLIGLAGAANGEWIVAFDGPVGQTGNWQAMLKPGEMVVIGTPGGGGHITTVVSGAGATAMLVDNAVFEGAGGQVNNPANDGSSSDIVIQPPHLASQEWSGVQADTVVIYQLDTPVVTDTVAADSLSTGTAQSLAALFGATDPAGRVIAEWQVYNGLSSDALVLGGADETGSMAAATALTVSSLAGRSLLAGGAAGTDTLEARAYNGSYWGDWQSLAVTITTTTSSPPPVIAAPVLQTPTQNQTWKEAAAVSLALPASAFTDPQGETLSYTATLQGGAALPAWLKFNAQTETFNGVPPNAAQTLTITVIATDTSGLSAADTFSGHRAGHAGGNQRDAGAELDRRPAGGADAAGRHLYRSAGRRPDLHGDIVERKAAARLARLRSRRGNLQRHRAGHREQPEHQGDRHRQQRPVRVGDVRRQRGAGRSTPFPSFPLFGITVTETPDQAWTDGELVKFQVPADTFSDALGLPLRFEAFQVGGPSVTRWLYFDPAKDTLLGTVPDNAHGIVELAVLAIDPLGMTAEDLFSVTLSPASGHTPFAATPAPPGSALLYNPPEPANALPLHS